VLIRDPLGELDPCALLCTAQAITPEYIVSWFVPRWRVEVTFEEARAHLGLETQRQWSDLAIARTTPALLDLFSWITLVAHLVQLDQPIPVRRAAWYTKSLPTFSDAIALARQALWPCSQTFSMSLAQPDMVEIPRPLLDSFLNTLRYAA
jgi:hypothetical protein